MHHPTTISAIRVVLADDSAELRAVWDRLLGRTPGLEVAAAVGSPSELLETIQRTRPDVVVLDLGMDGQDTAALIRQITREGARVIVYSGHDGARLVSALRAQGASGFVGKLEETTVLIGAIRSVAAGGEHFPSRTSV